MARKRKPVAFLVTGTASSAQSAAQIRRELKERINHSGFEYWDAEIKIARVAPVPRVGQAGLDLIMGHIRDVVGEADVSEPAGRGAGHSIDYDETILRQIIADAIGIKGA
jgi:hypothetical protein